MARRPYKNRNRLTDPNRGSSQCITLRADDRFTKTVAHLLETGPWRGVSELVFDLVNSKSNDLYPELCLPTVKSIEHDANQIDAILGGYSSTLRELEQTAGAK